MGLGVRVCGREDWWGQVGLFAVCPVALGRQGQSHRQNIVTHVSLRCSSHDGLPVVPPLTYPSAGSMVSTALPLSGGLSYIRVHMASLRSISAVFN